MAPHYAALQRARAPHLRPDYHRCPRVLPLPGRGGDSEEPRTQHRQHHARHGITRRPLRGGRRRAWCRAGRDIYWTNISPWIHSALRKTSLILSALSHQVPQPSTTPPISYFALDLEKRELERTLDELSQSNIGIGMRGKVSASGLCGTYDDGLKFIAEGGLEGRNVLKNIDTALTESYPVSRVGRSTSSDSGSSRSRSEGTDATPPSTPGGHQPLHIMFLGSSLGNFTRGEDAAFLKSLPLRPGSGDTLLLGLDHDNDPKKIELAYNDQKGVTREFIMNGLVCAGRALGDAHLFEQGKWEYVGKYNGELRRHEAYYKSTCDQTIVDPVTQAHFPFVKDELVRVEISNKFSDQDAYALFSEAGIRPVHRWTDSASQYSLWLLERPKFTFPVLKTPWVSMGAKDVARSSFSIPTVEEWHDMWAAWDFITREMIPPSMLFQKPIDLRHICLFYCGHIPTFLSIHLVRLLQEPDTEPVEFKYIFERGIDPIVDDPTQCHPHSQVPQRDEDWPELSSILQFQSRVRGRVMNLYHDIDAGKITLTRKIARVLFMTLEHEAFHAETLLYMLLQRAGTGTIPPSGFVVPVWDALAETWNNHPEPTGETVTLGPEEITLGHDDDEADDDSTDVLGHSFGWDNEHPQRTVRVGRFKIEWRPVTNGQFYDFYYAGGGQKMDKIQFPKSWIELDGQVFVRTLYGPVPLKIAHNWPLVTSYDNLSTYASVKGGRIPTEPELRLFHDKFECGYEGGANVGFRNWHPVPATSGGTRNNGKGHNGGVWEWTSTVFEKHDGFVPSKLYPGYVKST
ncbi:DUF323 domain-containing protein [Trametes gibbosa]|nr:DUF323 domain-containing protein [Trametes gibbosa]